MDEPEPDWPEDAERELGNLEGQDRAMALANLYCQFANRPDVSDAQLKRWMQEAEKKFFGRENEDTVCGKNR